MTRPLRNIFLEIPYLPYHITKRGNYRQQVFFSEADYRQYLNFLWCWQGRFFAAPLDDDYLSRAVRYVERHPVRAQLVAHPEDWPWSSALTHLQGGRLPGASYPPADALAHWREYLAMADPEEEIKPPVSPDAHRTSAWQRSIHLFSRNPGRETAESG